MVGLNYIKCPKIISLFLLLITNSLLGHCYIDKVYINAFSPEPNAVGLDSFDTDQNGIADAARDEFVQLCNDSSGLQ